MLGSVCTGPWTELGKWDEKGKENPTKANKTPKKQYQNAFSVESSWLNLYVFSIKVDIMLAKVHRTTKWTWKRPQKQKRRKRKNRRWQPMKAINFNSVSSPFPKRQTQWAVQRARRGQLQMGYGFRTFLVPLILFKWLYWISRQASQVFGQARLWKDKNFNAQLNI